MAYLLDSGILLRMANEDDGLHDDVGHALERLGSDQEILYTTTQNISEFWSVATRPAANNGFGWEPARAAEALSTAIEPLCGFLREHELVYDEFKRLGVAYEFRGKQAHDARIVAQILAWGLRRILTLNPRDFRRYEAEGIEVFTPQDLIQSQ